jgi:hypothetical protein
MNRVRAFLLIAVVLAARPAQAQFMMVGFHLSASAGLNVPISDLDQDAYAGFGISVRNESPLDPRWSLRNGLSYDRFGGKDRTGVDHLDYLALASDLVHHTNTRTYQFIGVGIYRVNTVFHPVTPTFGNLGNESQVFGETDVGFQGGVGLNFGTVTKTFLEVGIVDVLTTGRSSVWFPLRYGIRF